MSLTDSIDQLEAELGNRFDRLVRGLNDEIRRRIDQGQQEILRQLEQVSADLPAPLLSREDLDPLTVQAREEGFAGGAAAGRAAAHAELLEALRTFDSAGHQAELLDALLDQTARLASRTALFLTRSSGARYWAGRGWSENAALRTGLELAWDESAGWDRLATGSGPIELRSAECAPLCSRIESPLPREAVLIPLVLRDRVAAALYADRTDDGALDLPALQALTFSAALAIECLAFRERPATPTLAAAGTATAALALWDATAEPAPTATAGFVVEPEPEPEPEPGPVDSGAPEEAEFEPAEFEPVEFEPVEFEPVELAAAEPAPVEPAAAGFTGGETSATEFAGAALADVELAEADVVAEEPDAARIAGVEPVEEEEVALEAEFVLEPEPAEPPTEPAAEVPWSFEPSDEAWDAPPAAAETALGETAELSSAAIEDVWAGTSAIEDAPWPAAGLEPAATIEEPAAEEAWPPMPEPVSSWAPEPSPAWPAPEPELEPVPEAVPEPVLEPLSWAPAEEEIAPPPEYTAAPELEPEPEAAPPAVETVLLDRSAFAASLEAPPAPLPDEREETRPGLAGSAQVMPPSDFQGPGWAFATSRVQSAAAPAPTGGDDAAHEEARRLARLLVSEIRLYNEDQVEEGRRQRNLYDRLRDDIERSRQLYAERVDPRVLTAADYFDQELVRILAGGDAEALGR